nr:O-acetyl-ADP-ribose deacetylase MACROD2 isoform X3 [Columba livia]
MTLEERRKEYLRGYVALKNIPTWMEDLKSEDAKDDLQGKKSLSEKVSLYRGDITLLEVDAIVNAVDGCIHRAAGPCLVAECRNLSGCETGQAKITCGYDLPAKYVIHTVGPIARGHLTDTHKENLANCYKSSLKLAKENNIRSIAFPCISTGIYGFPNEPAAVIALNTAKEWLSKNYNEDWWSSSDNTMVIIFTRQKNAFNRMISISPLFSVCLSLVRVSRLIVPSVELVKCNREVAEQIK